MQEREENSLINNSVVRAIMHGFITKRIKNKNLSSFGQKVELKDIIEASPAATAGTQIHLNQTLTYEGENLKLLLFMALVLLKSKTLFAFLENAPKKDLTEMLALLMEYIAFTSKHADELDIPSIVINENKAALSNQLSFGQKAAIASFRFFNTKKYKQLGTELEASLHEANRLASGLVDKSSLPQGINAPGIVSSETLRLGFSGWS